ncbi:response regulator [Duganella sp. BJB488]|uniref:response regulator transcription factor n=1 Tax=unclassified Duganella TaxID=2636909 RepID=UPI000E34A212|nr:MULTISPECIES: response regulator [unclassified Duganella]RFP09143.1 response regulator [Duganella sp. BJB489]RFP12574.1 response regulator [Duganella sp. BJB488]RFP29140.1 response regulator [Duganella sp. BJB480]
MDTSLPWVAVVDDDEAVRRALLRLLRSAGIAARAYAGGAEFLAALDDGHPCCVVLDMHMPGLSGLEVQARLATLAPAVGVIIITGHQTAAEQAQAQLRQPLAYLNKPVDDQAILDAIGMACAKPSSPTGGPPP